MAARGGASGPGARRRRVGARVVRDRLARRIETGSRPEQVANRLEREGSGFLVGHGEPVDMAAGAKPWVGAASVRGWLDDIGVEALGVIAGITQEQRPLGGMGATARRLIWHRAPLVALHAQIDVGVRHVDREAELSRQGLAIRALGGPVGVVADGAGDAEIVLAACRVPLGVVGDHVPGLEDLVVLVTGSAGRARVRHEGTIVFPERPRVAGLGPLLLERSVDARVAGPAAFFLRCVVGGAGWVGEDGLVSERDVLETGRLDVGEAGTVTALALHVVVDRILLRIPAGGGGGEVAVRADRVA